MPTASRSTFPTLRPTGRQVAGGLGALCVLIIGLIGIPIVLASIIGWPVPHHVPSGTQAAHALGASIPDSFWPRLFATLAWLAWAYFVFSVVTGLVLQLRGRRPGHRSHLFGPNAMAALIAAVLILGQLRGAHSVANTVPTGPPAARPPWCGFFPRPPRGPPPRCPPLPFRPLNQLRSRPPSPTLSCSGDTLWSLAVQYYGDGEQWPAIFQANVGLSQPGGGALTDAHWIYPGWSLTIPGATQAPPVVPTRSPPMQAPSPAASSAAPTVTSPAAGTPGSIGHVSSRSGPDSTGSVSRETNAPAAHQPNTNQPPSDVRSVPPHHTKPAEPVGTSSSRPPLALHHSGAQPPTTLIGRRQWVKRVHPLRTRSEATSDRSPSAPASSGSPPSVWSPRWTAGGAGRSDGGRLAVAFPGRNRGAACRS